MTCLQYPLDEEAAAELFIKRKNILPKVFFFEHMESWKTLRLNSWVWAGVNKTAGRSAWRSDEAPGHAAKKKRKKKEEKKKTSAAQAGFWFSWGGIQVHLELNQSASSRRLPKVFLQLNSKVFYSQPPKKHVSICRLECYERGLRW